MTRFVFRLCAAITKHFAVSFFIEKVKSVHYDAFAKVRDKLGCRGNFPEIYDKVNKKARSGDKKKKLSFIKCCTFFVSFHQNMMRLFFFCSFVSFLNFRQREDRLTALKDVKLLLFAPFKICFKTKPSFNFLVL